MHENDKTAWRFGTLLLLIVVAGISSCSIHAENKTTEMVKNGTDPVAARCAIYGDPQVCTLAAMKDRK